MFNALSKRVLIVILVLTVLAAAVIYLLWNRGFSPMVAPGNDQKTQKEIIDGQMEELDKLRAQNPLTAEQVKQQEAELDKLRGAPKNELLETDIERQRADLDALRAAR